MYLYHFISIDLESSRSCNSTHCKAYSYEPGSHYLLSHQFTTSFKKPSQLQLPPCSVSSFFIYQTDGRLNIDRIEHQLHRTSIISNIDCIEHRSNRTLIEPNPTVRTRPYEPDLQIPKSNIEHRKSNIKTEHRKLNIENRTSNIDQTKRTNPTVQTRPPSTQIHNQSTNPPQRNDLIWRPSESPASAITWARSQSEMPEARNLSKTPEHEASKSQMHKLAWIY
jgi:hypothetical protein